MIEETWLDFRRHDSGVRRHQGTAPMALAIRDLMHPRRTVNLVIPCRVASPQSPTPLH